WTPTCCTRPPRARCWRTRRRKRRRWSISAPSRRWRRFPSKEAPPVVYQRTVSPMEAPDQATEVRIGFDKGDPVSLNGKKLSPAAILTGLNALGKTNGVGRIDLVENRFVGMKSRGVYETPGGTILLAAHRAMESITLDRGAA